MSLYQYDIPIQVWRYNNSILPALWWRWQWSGLFASLHRAEINEHLHRSAHTLYSFTLQEHSPFVHLWSTTEMHLLLSSKIYLPIWYFISTLYFLVQVSSQLLAISRRMQCWLGWCFVREFQDSNSGHNHISASSTPILCKIHRTKALPEI